MTPRRRALASALLAATTTAGPAALHVPAAQAATGSAPVTVPDAVTAFPNRPLFFDPLKNDSDPDGDDLAVCRTEPQKQGGVILVPNESQENGLVVFPRPSAKPGTYTFTYYACDFSYLTPGTITVTVEKSPRVKAVAVASKPGLVRFTNPADFAVTVLWGTRGENEPDGRIRVPAGESRTVRVHHERIIWAALNERNGFFAVGRVDLELPKGDRHPPLNDGGASDPSDSGDVAGRSWFTR